MSEQREALAAVLRDHAYDYPESFCECTVFVGHAPEREYPAHLADVILCEWLPGALADERVVEAAWDGIDAQHDEVGHVHASECCWSIPGAAEAALTAALTALTEDDA